MSLHCVQSLSLLFLSYPPFYACLSSLNISGIAPYNPPNIPLNIPPNIHLNILPNIHLNILPNMPPNIPLNIPPHIPPNTLGITTMVGFGSEVVGVICSVGSCVAA
eukprot:425979_1